MSLGALFAALSGATTAAIAQRAPAGPFPINEPKRVVILSEPAGALVVKNGSERLGLAPLAITLQRSGQRGFAAPVMFEALPSDSTQCAQAHLIDNHHIAPDTLEFFMRVCPAGRIRSDSVYASEDVTDPPVRVSSRPVRYPDNLRHQRVEGRVVVQFVVDTLGHVEPASVRVISAAHPDFGPPASELARASVFFPGHLSGRRVRVRVRMPVDFAVGLF